MTISRDIALRRADLSDLEMIFEWRNRPEIIALSASQRGVTWDEHVRWFRGVLGADDRVMFIIEAEGEGVGQIRFDRISDAHASVSIYLLPSHRGGGAGSIALKAACNAVFAELGVSAVEARIRTENVGSRAFFEKAGFGRDPGRSSDRFHVYVLEATDERRDPDGDASDDGP